MIINDRQIVISAAGSRKATFWPQLKLYWSESEERLKTPARGTETLAEYLSYPKAKHDELKDVGDFSEESFKRFEGEHKTVMHVHDEVILDVLKDKVDLKKVTDIMGYPID